MLADFFNAVFERLDSRFKPEIIERVDPKTLAAVHGYFEANGRWVELARGDSKQFRFKGVEVHSAKSLIDYAKSHATEAIEKDRALLRVNRAGLFLSIDFGAKETAEQGAHSLKFPAAFDEECEAAAAAIKSALGKWIPLEAFDAMLDKCAPFIGNFSAMEEAVANIEGKESVKMTKTATSFQVVTQGDVSCTADIPKFMEVRLLFMGCPVTANIPMRITVESKQVKFHLVDNGALATAQAAVMRGIKAEIIQALPGLLVIDGKLVD